jgi:hypothetical protein
MWPCVEDDKGFPVRTLILGSAVRGGSRPAAVVQSDQFRKLADPFDWWPAARPASRPVFRGLGRPDGDELCPSGEYTVYIEAAREHGTYQLIRQKLTLGAEPQSHKLTGNIEIKSTQLEYRRAATASQPPK